MSTNSNVQEMTDTADRVFVAANGIVEDMTDGSRKQIKDLATEVSIVLGMDPKQVLGFINYFVHKINIAYVTRGKRGGLIKGVKSAKVVKVKRVKKTDDNSTLPSKMKQS